MHGERLRRQLRREAREYLRTAHATFASMDAGGFAERPAQGCWPRGTRPPANRRAQDELAAQQAQIARRFRQGIIRAPAAVAPSSSASRWAGQRGGPNRDITAQLFLSPCTVEYHLRKVYRKLGVAPVLPRTESGLVVGRTRNCRGQGELPHALSGLGHE